MAPGAHLSRGFRYDFYSMPTLDGERERRRLAELYAGMSDDELRRVAADTASLTEEAQDVLEEELERRGIENEEETAVPPAKVEQRRLATVRQFRDLPDALLAKGMLDSVGIECFLADDNMVRLDWFISNLLGGIKLRVNEKDFREALRVLNEPAPADFYREAADSDSDEHL